MVLGTLSFLLGIAWLIAYFVLDIHAGYVHVLLALALVLTMARVLKNPRKRGSDY